MRTFMKFSAGLIGLYLIVEYAPGVSVIVKSAGEAASGYARTLMGPRPGERAAAPARSAAQRATVRAVQRSAPVTRVA